MAKKKVLLLAETGFVIRNLLLGYFADEISKNAVLIVAVQNPQDPHLATLVQEKSIQLIDFPRETMEDKRNGWQRFISWDNWIYGVRLARRRNKSLKIQTRLFEGVMTWRRSLLYRIPSAIGKLMNLLGLYSSMEDIYLNAYILKKPITRQWISIIQEIKPDLVFSSMLTHSVRMQCSIDLPAVVAAHQAGVKTCTLVQSWDNLSSKISVLPKWLDRYFTWSAPMTEELLEMNPRIANSQVAVVGSPQYDFHLDGSLLMTRDAYFSNLGLSPSKSLIVIGTGTARWMPDEMEKVITLSSHLVDTIPDVQVMIRLHPKDHGDRWLPYHQQLDSLGIHLQKTSPEEHMDKGGFIPPKDFYRDQINTIGHSAVVINSSSSLTVDAAILDKPVICIAYDLRPDPLFKEGRSLAYSQSVHYGKLVKTGGVAVVDSEQVCISTIREYLKNPSLHRQERAAMVGIVTDQIHLKSGLRLAAEVNKLLN